jgi:hypothetical protein
MRLAAGPRDLGPTVPVGARDLAPVDLNHRVGDGDAHERVVDRDRQGLARRGPVGARADGAAGARRGGRAEGHEDHDGGGEHGRSAHQLEYDRGRASGVAARAAPVPTSRRCE